MTTAEVGNLSNSLVDFFSATFAMSWQMAIVVLVPILAGFELDQKIHAQPVFTILGFLLAIAGMVVVVRHQLQRFRLPARAQSKRAHS